MGAIVVATGYKLYSIGREQKSAKITGYGEYGYGKYKDVIDSLQFERLISASGPTNGETETAVGREDSAEGGFHFLRGIARQRQGAALLLQDLLHVHRQAHHAVQA